MQNSSDLSEALVKLSQQVLRSAETDKLALVILQLHDLDQSYFQELFTRLHVKDFKVLRWALAEYYARNLNSRIILSCSGDEDEEFIGVYECVLDLALSRKKQAYISAMMALKEDNSRALIPFVQQITNRQFVKELTVRHCLDVYCLLYEKEHENNQLRNELEGLHHKYADATEQNMTLRTERDARGELLAESKQEKEYLLRELNCPLTWGYADLLDKFRNELGEYQTALDKSFRAIEEKEGVLGQKEKEMQILSVSMLNQMETVRQNEDHQLKVKNSELQKQVQRLSRQQQKSKLQLQSLRELLSEKQVLLARQTQALAQRAINEQKYEAILRLHQRFRTQVTKDLKH